MINPHDIPGFKNRNSKRKHIHKNKKLINQNTKDKVSYKTYKI